jgi:two-component system chemotaxis sensor kinase CheA
MNVQIDENLNVYLSDAVEAVRAIETSLLALGSDPGSESEINQLYRGMHTLKGNAGFMQFGAIEHVAHACEDLVSLVRDGGQVLDDDMTRLLHQALEFLRAAHRRLAETATPPSEEDVAGLVGFLADAYIERGGERRSTLDVDVVFFDDLPPLPAPASASSSSADEPSADPSVAALASMASPGSSPSSPSPASRSPASASPASASMTSSPSSSSATLPATAATSEAPVTATSKASAPTAATSKSSAPKSSSTSSAPKSSSTSARVEFVRVDAAKIAALMDLAGELGLACSAVTHHPDTNADSETFGQASHRLEGLVRALQNDLAALRLVPVAPVFERLRRVVEDAARRTGKEVELTLRGEDTEVDKVMIDALQDPLVHALRNAVDHGIESPEERVARGKPPVGRVMLAASYQAGEVTIEIRDDGRGLVRDKIVARARQRGLCADDVQLDDDEILQFIFAPGFSTKEQVDALSGRGVGMDVLKTTVEAMRGRVEVKSAEGQGTRFALKMPLTLAFVEAMVVRERDRLFAIPIERVCEVSKIQAAELLTNAADGEMLLHRRDLVVPILWLHSFWNEAREAAPVLADRLMVLVQSGAKVLALPVDEILGNQQVMLKPLQGALRDIRAAAGCGMLRGGEVAIAIDCDRLHA